MKGSSIPTLMLRPHTQFEDQLLNSVTYLSLTDKSFNVGIVEAQFSRLFQSIKFVHIYL